MRWTSLVGAIALVSSLGCSPPGSSQSDGGLTEACFAPVAIPRGPLTGARYAPAVVDALASQTRAGALVDWTLGAPPGSQAHFDSPNAMIATFVPDVLGQYVATLVVSDQCGESEPAQLSILVANRPPVAQIVQPPAAHRNQAITLDSSGSVDPDGTAITYQWSVVRAPAGATATVTGSQTASATFTADTIGDYTVSLQVTDDAQATASAQATIQLRNAAPVVDAGPALAVNLPHAVTLHGSASDDDDDPIQLFWSISAAPQGSTARLSDPASATPTFQPDVEGLYRFTLTGTDATATSTPSETTVVASRHVDLLAHDVIDAEYDTALDRIVMVSSAPASLEIYDPQTANEVTVPLALRPTSVSIAPDGLTAVVGHSAYLTEVDLTQGQTIRSPVPVQADVGDVVWDGTRAYVFPSREQWVRLHTVVMATGEETTSSAQIYAGTLARLAPGGGAIYGAETNSSPASTYKYSLDGGTAQQAYESQYFYAHPMCGPLWFTEDGGMLITACGGVYRVNPSATKNTDDILYAGTLEGVGSTYYSATVRWASHSAVRNEVAMIPINTSLTDTADQKLDLLSGDYFALTSSIALPQIAVSGQGFAGHGRYVFHRSDGNARYVIVATDGGTSLPSQYGVVTY